ncbi:MAG: DUF86 domain-containing protein [Lachnospiraceae bacterium]|nr:DUF86 domain-containing protein [Lachnospiraceae bacterium]
MKQLDSSRLKHIVDYCDEISNTVARYGNAFSIFESDSDYQKSVAFSVLQIGELCAGLSDEFRTATSSQMPWQSIKGMRNIVVHNYGSVDRVILWNPVNSDIPKLREFCLEQIRIVDEESES